MPAYGFPTTTEVTDLEGTTISTTSDNGYNFITGEIPVPSAKFRGWLKATKDLFAFVKADEEALIFPTLTNSWVPFGGAFSDPSYFKSKNNVVRLAGLAKSGTINLPSFTLPVGYRPAHTLIFATSTAVGSTITFGEVRVLASGAVTISAGGNAYGSFNNVIFRV